MRMNQRADYMQTFSSQGFLGPQATIGPEVMEPAWEEIRDSYERALPGKDERVPDDWRRNRHFDWPVIKELSLAPRISETLGQLLGPGILTNTRRCSRIRDS
jgi:hypothetical protein